MHKLLLGEEAGKVEYRTEGLYPCRQRPHTNLQHLVNGLLAALFESGQLGEHGRYHRADSLSVFRVHQKHC